MSGFRWIGCLAAGCLLAGCAGSRPPEAAVGGTVPENGSPTVAPAVKADSGVPVLPRPQEIENSIYFKASDAALADEELGKLRRHAEHLKGSPKTIVTLIGHTDNQGSRSYKLAVADERVRAVFRQLLKEGVPRRQLRSYPAGKEMNGRGCETAECQAFMRRVELVYSVGKGTR